MSAAPAIRRKVTIVNARGLHARASAKFVETACAYKADVTVARDGETVSGASIMGLLMLGAGPGVEIEISADGAEAEAAVAALVRLVEARFHED